MPNFEVERHPAIGEKSLHVSLDRRLEVRSDSTIPFVEVVTGSNGERPAIFLSEPRGADRVDSRLVYSQKQLSEILRGEHIPVISAYADVSGDVTAFGTVVHKELEGGRMYVFSDAIVATEGAQVHFANRTKNGGMLISFDHVTPDGKGQRAEVLLAPFQVQRLGVEKEALESELKVERIIAWANHVTDGDFSGDTENDYTSVQTKVIDAPVGEFDVEDTVLLDLNDTSMSVQHRERLLGWIEHALHSRPEEAEVSGVYVSPDGGTRFKVFAERLGTENNPWHISEWVNEGEEPQYILWSESMYEAQEEVGYTKMEQE